ncbi:hypothetical protein BH09ACT7_BH09ACT7_22610 [soil metagenome]
MNAQPGEVHHEKARAMNKVFAACLQQIVKGFRTEFHVNKNPEKLIIEIPSHRDFSFDMVARLRSIDFDGEVWIEGKAYESASDLLQHYRLFVRRVALARIHSKRVKNDKFWFVSSAPFACGEGSEIGKISWLRSTILDTESKPSKQVVISAEEINIIETLGYESLARSISALILTTTLMQTTKLKHFPEDGDNLWSLTEDLYGGRVPENWSSYTSLIAELNGLRDPNHILPGQDLELPFQEDLLPIENAD